MTATPGIWPASRRLNASRYLLAVVDRLYADQICAVNASAARLLAIAVLCLSAIACYSTDDQNTSLMTAEWRVAEPVTATSSTVDLYIKEPCSGGASPAGRIADPIVEYGVATIWITVPIRSVSKSLMECFKADPEYPLVVELTQPVGDRELKNGYDGNHFRELPPDFSPAPLPRPIQRL